MDPSPRHLSFPAGRWSVRTLLFWLVFVCLLPGVVGALTLFVYEYRKGRAQLEMDTIQTARALVQAVDKQILQAQALAQGLATSELLATGNFGKFHEQARRALAQSSIGSTVSLNKWGGQQLLNTARIFGEPLPLNGSPELVNRVFETGKPVVSDIFIGSVQGYPLVAVGVPVSLDRGVAYGLTVTVLPATFNAILKAQGLPPGWVATIFDSRGIIVARSREPERFVGQKPAAQYFKELMASPEGTFTATMKDGTPVLAAHTRSWATDWRVAISISQEVLVADLTRHLFVLGFGISLLFVVGLGLAWFIGHKIARSFQDLVPAAIALGSGGTVSLPATEVTEAAELTRAMGEAANILEERTSALRESETRFRSTFEQTIVGLAHISLNGQMLRVNAKFAEIVGHDREALLGMSFQEITHPEDLEADLANFARCLSGEISGYSMEKRYIRGDGSAVWCNLTVTLVRNAAGGAEYFVSVVEDIQARKEAEWALAEERESRQRQLAGQVEERTVELTHSNEALMRSNMELRSFAHVAAHDLQTPLRSIAGFAQLLRQSAREKLTERETDWLALVIDNTQRLQKLIQELLTYARLDAQARPLERANLKELVDKVLATLTAPIGEAGAEVTYGDLPVLSVDRTQFAQLMQNLIENAIKYRSDQPPKVTIACERREREWVFSVTDNGMGIEARHQQQIFEIFRRLHTYNDIPGTGIGLAICRRVVERHGGRMWVESAPGKGSTFCFTLPLEKAI